MPARGKNVKTLWIPRPDTDDPLELAKWSYRTLVKSTEELIERAKKTKKEDIVYYEGKNGPTPDRLSVEDVPFLSLTLARQKKMLDCLNEHGMTCFHIANDYKKE